jgi:hypothetical protein
MEAYGLIDKLSDYALEKGWLFFNGDNYYTNIDADVEIADNQFVLRVNLNAVPTRSGGNRTNTINYTGLIALGRKREVVSGQETTEASLDESFEQKYNRRLKEMINTLSVDMGEFACANGCQILTENYIYDVNQFDTNIDFVVGQFNIEQFAFDYIEPATYSVTLETVGDGTIISNPTSLVNLKKGTVVSLGAAPDEGWSFEKWIINNVENMHQIFGFNITNNVNAVAHFVKGAFVNVLHVFDTIPVKKGDRPYFGDYAKDNDVQVKNVRVGKFSGGQYVSIGAGVINPNQDFSIIIVYKKTDTNANQRLFSHRSENGEFFSIYSKTGFVLFEINDSNKISGYDQYLAFNLVTLTKVGTLYTLIVNGITAGTYTGDHTFRTDIPSQIGGMFISAAGAWFVGEIAYFNFNELTFVFNHGQNDIIHEITGSGNNGTIIGATLPTFWGSTSDEVMPYDATLGATLYKWNGELIINGKFNTNINSWTAQSNSTNEWSSDNGGSLKVISSASGNRYSYQIVAVEIGVEYEVSAYIKSGGGQLCFIQCYNAAFAPPSVSSSGTTDTTQYVKNTVFFTPTTTTMNVLCVITASAANQTAYFDEVSIKKVGFNSPTIMPICMNTNEEVDRLDRLGYFPPGSGILKGLPNKYEIPVDPELNTYLPAGDYDYDELMAIPASANIEMTKNENTISLLKVHG